jgi:hypothetical protein
LDPRSPGTLMNHTTGTTPRAGLVLSERHVL